MTPVARTEPTRDGQTELHVNLAIWEKGVDTAVEFEPSGGLRRRRRAVVVVVAFRLDAGDTTMDCGADDDACDAAIDSKLTKARAVVGRRRGSGSNARSMAW